MALVVEDGTGLATAESYASVSDADAYFANWGTPTSWSTAATADKEEFLRNGSRYVDDRYRARAQGNRLKRDQGLIYPRIGITDDDGWLYDSNSVPSRVVTAAIVMAGKYGEAKAAGTALSPDEDANGVQATSVSLGPISESTTYAVASGGSSSTQPTYIEVDRLMAPLLRPAGQVRLA